MKRKITVGFLGMVAIAVGAWGLSKSIADRSPQSLKATSHDVAPAGVYYTCPMHPSIHSDGPGKCPTCGMDLVKTNAPAHHRAVEDEEVHDGRDDSTGGSAF